MAKQIQDVEEKLRTGTVDAAPSKEAGHALAGTLAEFYEAQARWGRDISTEEREKMIKEASKSKSVRLVKRIEHKLSLVSAFLQYNIHFLFTSFAIFDEITSTRWYIKIYFCLMR